MLSHFLSIIGFRWQDAIDIAISGYILFRLYLLFKGTNVMRVLVGITLLLFLGNMANFLGLVVTSWAIQGVTAAAALVIIIIFRNEIRNILEAQNLRTYFWSLPHKTITVPVDEITEAVFELARLHIGALIVIPGKENIKNIIQGAKVWQGTLSKEMLMSIFWHNNPVHDGAAVISGKQVSEVMAILPLTTQNDLPSYYGTRHRAALGMAEFTDALTLVVSEERGVVAIAKANKIRAISLKEDLRNILNAHLGISEKKGLSRREFIEISITALASVALVCGIWFNLVKGNTTLVTVDASIQLINNDSGTELLSMEPNTVRLQLSGSDRLMRSFRPEQAQVRLDISMAHIGSNALSIRNEDISLPPGIVLNRIDQASVKIDIDKQIRKKLPVKVNWTEKLSDDLVLKTVTVDPQFIEISGMSRIINNISFVFTEAVDQSRILASGSITVAPLLAATGVTVTPESKPKIIITYVVESKNLKP